jgi:hypothetical protein
MRAEYELNKKKSILINLYKYDSLNNLTTYITNKHENNITYEYNYLNLTYKSSYILIDKKLLMSLGELDSNYNISSEAYYWLPYNEIFYY